MHSNLHNLWSQRCLGFSIKASGVSWNIFGKCPDHVAASHFDSLSWTWRKDTGSDGGVPPPAEFSRSTRASCLSLPGQPTELYGRTCVNGSISGISGIQCSACRLAALESYQFCGTAGVTNLADPCRALLACLECPKYIQVCKVVRWDWNTSNVSSEFDSCQEIVANNCGIDR